MLQFLMLNLFEDKDENKMSLKKKRKNSRPSFVLTKGRKPGHVVMFEKDEEGMSIMSEGMEFRPEELRKRPIDLLTHELSEREIKRSIEKAGERPTGSVVRYSKTGGEFDVPIPHAMVSHHTTSGIIEGGRHKVFSPEEFKLFFWDTGKVEKVYPKMEQYRVRWNALGKISKRTTTKDEIKGILVKMKRIERESRGEVPVSITSRLNAGIRKWELKLEEQK